MNGAAVGCDRTALLESGPGHATRCAPSPFVKALEEEKRRLARSGLPGEELRHRPGELNIGRLRIASKGQDRHPRHGHDPEAPKLLDLDEGEQWSRGMFMIGQVAAIRSGTCAMAELHDEISAGATRQVEAIEPPPQADEPAPETAAVAIVGMACILPGAPDLRALWADICSKVDAITEVPCPTRFGAGLDACVTAQGLWGLGLAVRVGLTMALGPDEAETSLALALPPGNRSALALLAARQVDLFVLWGWAATAAGGWRRADNSGRRLQAEADVTKAGRDASQSGRLANRGYMTRTELADSRTLLAKAEAVLRMSRLEMAESEAMRRSSQRDVERTEIRSPVDGIVSNLNVEVREVVIAGTTNRAGTVLMTVSNLSGMRVRVDIDETYIALIHRGQPAQIYLQADLRAPAVDLLAARDLQAQFGHTLSYRPKGEQPATAPAGPKSLRAPRGACREPGYGSLHSTLSADQGRRLNPRRLVPTATVNDLLLASLHRTVAAWNAGHGRPCIA